VADAAIGIFGGSGFYSFLEDVEELEVDTPYGKPSAPFVVGERSRACESPSYRATGASTSCRRTRSRTGRTSGR